MTVIQREWPVPGSPGGSSYGGLGPRMLIRQGLGGLLVSQWLTLYTTPVIYLYLDRFAAWVGGTLGNPCRRTGEFPDRHPHRLLLRQQQRGRRLAHPRRRLHVGADSTVPDGQSGVWEPCPEENPQRAWYIKTKVKGAPSGKLARKTVVQKAGLARRQDRHCPAFSASIPSCPGLACPAAGGLLAKRILVIGVWQP